MAKIDMSKDPVMQELRRDNPGNSKSEKKRAIPDREKQTKVISGGVKLKKKGFGRKVADLFVGEDVDNVAEYVIHDVLVPSAKNMISDMVSGGIEMLMFGESRGGRTRRDRGSSYVSYNQKTRGVSTHNDRRSVVGREDVRARNSQRMDDIIFETRGDAEQALSALADLVDDYGSASMNDLYDIIGQTGSYTDVHYGWDNLARATVHRVREGYLLELPKVIAI